MKYCNLCHNGYVESAQWCPRCYDDSGHPILPGLASAVEVFKSGDRAEYIGRGSAYHGNLIVEMNGKHGDVMAVDGSGMVIFQPDDPDATPGSLPFCFQTHAINLRKIG